MFFYNVSQKSVNVNLNSENMTARNINATKSNLNDNLSTFNNNAPGLNHSLNGNNFSQNSNLLTRNMLSTIHYDIRMYSVAVDSLKAQAKMNIKRNIISNDFGTKIIDILNKVKKEISEGTVETIQGSIYDLIEKKLVDTLGKKALDFKIAKSHQEQLVGDTKLWVRNAYDALDSAMHNLHSSLIDKAEENVKTIMPGFEHMQTAQPTTLAHHLMAYVDMFGRDRERMSQARVRMNTSPYGSTNSVGTTFNINRDMVARTLGFDSSCTNSEDAICDRDFLIEFASSASICATHISRFSSEIINWNSQLMNFVSLSSDFNTISSVIPDFNDSRIVELVRANCSKIYGALNSVISTMHSLPLSFSEDLVATTEYIFNIHDTLVNSINLLSSLVADMKVNRKNMKEAAYNNYSTANDIQDWLIENIKLSFTEAQNITKQIIEFSIVKGKKLSLLELDELKNIESKITNDIYSVLIPSRAIITRRSNGGSNPVQTRKAIRSARRKFL